MQESRYLEWDYPIEEIEGRFPDRLTGTLYRNGPAQNDVGGQPFGHWFDGDGMLSAVM
ncbi:MAG: carotenoid oxygenase family protein [Candidatus Rokubacteria bacterium]|nr:carotenoid oxygenase family protein [Candidatus Rokubacteria bacterium]